jgi:hypothetical protein
VKKWIVIALWHLCIPNAHAARPFVTDDARLTNEDSCQLESWARHYQHSDEAWALPACNLGGNFELTAGAGRAQAKGEGSTTDYVLQGKTLFKPLSTNDWGWGLAIGTVRHPSINPGPNLLGNSYFYVPASRSLMNDDLIVHANLGMLRDTQTGIYSRTWGLGGEFKLSARLLGIAEGFGDHRNPPYWQVGGRYAIVPERVQVDATLGEQFNHGRATRWISFGLRLTPGALF